MAEHAKTVDREDHVTLCTLINGPFERTTTLMTFEDCLVNAISEPEEFKALIDALCDYRIEIIEHLAEYVKPDVINLHDDWGTSTNMMLSPDLWREVIKPGTKRIYDRCHELGIIVGQHSCGHIEEIVGEILDETDFDGDLVTPCGAGAWRADGRLPVEQALELGWPVSESDDYETIAGWIMDTVDFVPQTGDRFCVEGFSFKIERMRRSRISTVYVKAGCGDESASGKSAQA